jgi:hypothetical protein
MPALGFEKWNVSSSLLNQLFEYQKYADELIVNRNYENSENTNIGENEIDDVCGAIDAAHANEGG